MLGPLTISRDGRRAHTARIPQGARAVRLPGSFAAAPCRGASCASFCGMFPTIRAESCAGASARSELSSTSPSAGASYTREDTIGLDLTDCFVDAIEIARATQAGIEALAPERAARSLHAVQRRLPRGLGDRSQPAVRRLAHRSAATIPRASPHRAAGAACRKASRDDEAFGYLESGFSSHRSIGACTRLLLTMLARRGRIREGEEHLAATVRLFEAEGLDHAALRDAWRAARTQGANSQPASRPISLLTTSASQSPEHIVAAAPRRASIAVMPFVDQSTEIGARGGAADALAARRDHPAREAAQPVRHRAGHRVRAARAAHRRRKRPAGR